MRRDFAPVRACGGAKRKNEPHKVAAWRDGSKLSQSQYAALYAAIGTNSGANPPAGEFYIPDRRGRFVRGQGPLGQLDPDAAHRTDMQTGTTVGPTVGSVQNDASRTTCIRTRSSLPAAG